jgi:hypothetical protein
MNKVLTVKDRQELEKNLQILGRGIGKVRVNEKGEIFVLDQKKSGKEYKIGQV